MSMVKKFTYIGLLLLSSICSGEEVTIKIRPKVHDLKAENLDKLAAFDKLNAETGEEYKKRIKAGEKAAQLQALEVAKQKAKLREGKTPEEIKVMDAKELAEQKALQKKANTKTRALKIQSLRNNQRRR